MIRQFLLVCLWCALTGCSVLAPVSKGYLQANVAAYEALPVAVQQAQPEFFQRVYFTASVMVTPPADWRIALHSPQPLQLPAAVPVWLRYQLDEQTFSLLTHWQVEPAAASQLTAEQAAKAPAADAQPAQQTATAQTTDAQTTNTQTTNTQATPTQIANSQAAAARPYVYLLKPPRDIQTQPFWQQYEQHRWEGDKPSFDYFLQPELAVDTRQIELRYQLARHGGFLTAGGFARKLLVGRDKRLAQLCDNQQYRYLKTSACGAVQIRELAPQPVVAAAGSVPATAVGSAQ